MKDKVLFTVKKRHFLYALLVAVFIVACSPKSNNYKPDKVYATEYNFSKYKGKIVAHINYCDGCGSSGDDLIITFTDGSKLKVWAYKYNMKVYLNGN